MAGTDISPTGRTNLLILRGNGKSRIAHRSDHACRAKATSSGATATSIREALKSIANTVITPADR
jgi:hypothetical protein